MGNGVSVPTPSAHSDYKLPVPGIFQAISKYKPQLQYLQLTEADIVRCYHIYNQLKEDKSDDISISKISSYFDLRDSLFFSRLFLILPISNSGYLSNFIEFVAIIWQFCTVGKNLGNPRI